MWFESHTPWNLGLHFNVRGEQQNLQRVCFCIYTQCVFFVWTLDAIRYTYNVLIWYITSLYRSISISIVMCMLFVYKKETSYPYTHFERPQRLNVTYLSAGSLTAWRLENGALWTKKRWSSSGDCLYIRLVKVHEWFMTRFFFSFLAFWKVEFWIEWWNKSFILYIIYIIYIIYIQRYWNVNIEICWYPRLAVP